MQIAHFQNMSFTPCCLQGQWPANIRFATMWSDEDFSLPRGRLASFLFKSKTLEFHFILCEWSRTTLGFILTVFPQAGFLISCVWEIHRFSKKIHWPRAFCSLRFSFYGFFDWINTYICDYFCLLRTPPFDLSFSLFRSVMRSLFIADQSVPVPSSSYVHANHKQSIHSF